MQRQVPCLELAMELREASQRSRALARMGGENAATALAEQSRLIEQLVDALRVRETRLAEVNTAVADRLNNLLMSVQTAADLLRKPIGEGASQKLCERLDETVVTGRDALRQIHAGLDRLR